MLQYFYNGVLCGKTQKGWFLYAKSNPKNTVVSNGIGAEFVLAAPYGH